MISRRGFLVGASATAIVIGMVPVAAITESLESGDLIGLNGFTHGLPAGTYFTRSIVTWFDVEGEVVKSYVVGSEVGFGGWR